MEFRLMENEGGFEIINADVQVGRIVWTLQDDVMVMNGTFIDESLRGKSAGQKLLTLAANYAREHGYKMQAVCPYVVKQFEHVADYDDVKI